MFEIKKFKHIKRISRISERFSPPGMDTRYERRFVLWGLIISFAYSLLFFVSYFSARRGLYIYEGGKRVLNTDAIMTDFVSLIHGCMNLYFAVALCTLAFVFYRYAYYHIGSKSIYTMKRLPNKTEIHSRAWVIPLSYVVFCAAVAVLTVVLYFIFYVIVTPNECISEGQLAKLFGCI